MERSLAETMDYSLAVWKAALMVCWKVDLMDTELALSLAVSLVEMTDRLMEM